MNKFILPIIALFIGNSLAVMLLFSESDVSTVDQKKLHVPVVETQLLKKQAYTVKVRSSGKVLASKKTKLVAEVAGSIVKVSPSFEEGGYFSKGDILLQIDDSDFINAVTVAKSDVDQKQRQFDEEKARAFVEYKDRRLLDAQKNNTDPVTQKPDIANTKSLLDAAQAKLDQAEKNLERTYIRAPYSGQVLKREVDVGQFVSAGMMLGEVYSKDVLEVHLPVSLQQYKQLALDDSLTLKNTTTEVEYYMVQGKKKLSWSGDVIRSSAMLDATTNQLTVIASIEETDAEKIKIGQFLRANIYGRVYQNVYVIPRSSVRKNKEILLLKNVKEGEAEVSIASVEVIRTEGNKSIVKGLFDNNSHLVITPMPLVKSGLKVRIKKEKAISG